MMKLIEHPIEYKQGVRVLMLTLRTKDGGKNKPDNYAKKLISRNAEEFDKCLSELLAIRKGQERIYASIDQRSLSKAIRLFKHLQIDAETEADPYSFYVDCKNRFISSLMKPASRKEKLFLVDIDENEGDDADAIRAELLAVQTGDRRILGQKEDLLLHEYRTKNGVHMITRPFNLTLVSFKDKIRTNHLMLWAYEENNETV